MPAGLRAFLTRPRSFIMCRATAEAVPLAMLSVGQHHQVFGAIIGAFSVDVMHHLAWFKRHAMRFFPHDLVFGNIALAISARMLGPKQHHIAFPQISATFPSVVLRSFHSTHIVAFYKGSAASAISLLSSRRSGGHGTLAATSAKGAFFDAVLGGILSHGSSITQVSIAS